MCYIMTANGFTLLTSEERDKLYGISSKDNKTTNKVEQSSINEITIPFGAKDSELQEATYFIPKGFHAEINDDKVVIKKGESLKFGVKKMKQD